MRRAQSGGMEPLIVAAVICLMPEQVAVRARFPEDAVTLPGTLADGERDGAVRPAGTDRSDNVCKTFIRIPPVFAALEHKGTESQFVSVRAAVKDLFFRQPVALCVRIAFPDPAVIAVISAVISKLDQPPDVHVMPVMPDADLSCPIKEIPGCFGAPSPDEICPFTASQGTVLLQFVDQRLDPACIGRRVCIRSQVCSLHVHVFFP